MFRVLPNISFKHLVAITLVVATFVVSCKGEAEGDLINLEEVPMQTVEDMYAVQSQNGLQQMRMEAPLMQRFKTSSDSYELFPNGFYVYGYNSEGLLETKIRADKAKHTTKEKEEKWEAFGNVVITNYIKGENMETDTLYWDRENKKIFTHCFVKMYSPDGYMQGVWYGKR
jgi:Protein of unknown function (DUF1239).